jgi:uncharacterized pyridoxamine 5'-phosphate oxidase family protein
MDGNQPRVRPFGTVNIFDGKLYIQTEKNKNVSKQIHSNPKIEISGMYNGKWIRLEAFAVEDDNLNAKKSMLKAYPMLENMYSAEDKNTELFYLKNATATINSLEGDPVILKF